MKRLLLSCCLLLAGCAEFPLNLQLQPGIDASMLTQGAQVTLNVEEINGQALVTELQVN